MTTKLKTITITVYYDADYNVPSDDFLKDSISEEVGDGLLSRDSDDTIVESWSVEVG
jgi:hypothetical protein